MAVIFSGWLYEILNTHVDEIVVAGVTETRGPKSDARDAYGLPKSCAWRISRHGTDGPPMRVLLGTDTRILLENGAVE